MEFWFRRKFNLAPTDPRFLDATTEDIVTEYWAWHYLDHPDEEEFEDEAFDEEAEGLLADMAANPDEWVDVVTGKAE